MTREQIKSAASGEMCGDNRFDIISRAKEDILKSTNISSSPKELEVLDNFLFMCWQMGWLNEYANFNKKTMTRDQIKEHYADVVKCVFLAESVIKPTLQERKAALGKNPTHEQMEEMGRRYCLDIAEEILSRTSDAEVERLYKDKN